MKKVLITGASRGIGYAMADAFAEQGYRVFALWHNAKENLENTKENVTPVQGDVSSYASMQRVREEIGAVDILINNAAISHFGLLTDLSEEEWDHILDTDLKSVFLTAKVFLPDMVRNHSGKIINVSSIFGAVGGSCEVAYSTAKAGMIGFTKALAKEVGPSGIQVNCIAPGVIETEMNKRLSNADKAALAEETPLGRLGTPEEVARLALYLAEDTFITGETIHIGGGFML